MTIDAVYDAGARQGWLHVAMTVPNHPQVDQRYLTASADLRGRGVPPALERILLPTVVGHPSFFAPQVGTVDVKALDAYLDRFLAHGELCFSLSQYAYARRPGRVRQIANSNGLTDWSTPAAAVALLIDPERMTGGLLGSLHGARTNELLAVCHLVAGMLDGAVDPTPILNSRKTATLLAKGVAACLAAGHTRWRLTDGLPVDVPGVTLLDTPCRLIKAAHEMANCLGDPDWAVDTLLGRHKLALATHEGVKAVGLLRPAEDGTWVPDTVLGARNARLPRKVERRIRAMLARAGGAGE